jgi:hypothetical protein
MLAWKYRIFLAAGTLGLAAWAGYSAERRVMDSAGNKPLTFQSVVRRVMAPKSRTERIDRLNELRHLAGRSHPTARETTEFWEIVRALGIEDVKACLAEIPQKPYRAVNDMLVQMLFYRWAQMDPEGAARVAMQPPYEENYSAILSVATAWAARDAEGALRFAATLPDSSGKNMFGNTAGRVLASQDPENAVVRASAEFPIALYGVVASLVGKSGETEEARMKRFSQLAALPDRKWLKFYLNQLTWMNPEKARATLDEAERAGVPEEEIRQARERLERSSGHKDSQQRMEALQADGSEEGAKEQVNLFRGWAANEADKAAAWASRAGRVDLVAEAVKTQSASLLRSNWQPAVGLPHHPYVKGVLTHYDTWRKMDASAAEAWLQTMPTDIRKHLSPDHATH